MLRYLTIIVALLALVAHASVAQQAQQFRNYSAEQGLSQSVVLTMEQDNRGYLWVGTEVGLNRFDGFRFTSFYREDGLPSNRIHVVRKDRDGNLWVGTDNGLARWNGRNFEVPPIADTLLGKSVLSIHHDSKNRLWVGTDGDGVWLIDGKNIKAFKTADGMAGNRVRDIVESQDGTTIWIGTRDGLTALFENGRVRTWTTKEGLPDDKIRSLTLDNAGHLWVGTRAGLAVMRGTTIIATYTTEQGLVSNMVKEIVFDLFNRAWIATEEGFSIFQDGSFSNFGLGDGFGSSIFNTAFQDDEGNMWVGTFGSGIFRYLGSRFETLKAPDPLPDNMVTAIRKKGDALWVSTYGGGVAEIRPTGHRHWNTQTGLLDERVFDLYIDPASRVWVATRNGISIISDGSVEELSEGTGLPFRVIRTITPDPDGSLWFGTDGGGLIHYRNGQFENITTAEGLIHNTVRSVEFDPEGGMWVGTYGGLNHYKDGTHTHYTTSDGLANNIVLDLLVEEDGSVWAATFDGVSHLKEGLFTNYTKADGLPSEVVYLVHKDDYENYWLGTTRGLVRFRSDRTDGIQRPIFKRYTTDYGLAADELNRGAVFGTGDTLWFGTVGGLSIYYRQRDPDLSHQPPVYIEQLRVFDQTITDFRDLDLSYADNSLWFDYTALSFSAPDKIAYEYRLRPVDTEWIPTDLRSARYAGLPAGDYVFEVRARNNDGNWSEQPAKLAFTIHPPFYSTWWFRLLLVVFFVGVVAFVYNYYKVNKQVELERMRVRIASDLHDDVGASLTEIALQTDFLRAHPLPEDIRAPLQQIGETSRRIVTTMDDIVWSIDARNDTVGDLTDRMQDYARSTLTPKGISFNFTFDHLDTAQSLPVEVRQNVYLIFKEMINNTVKHSGASQVDIRLSKHNGVSTMVIKDNGVGLSKQHRKTGHGLKNLKLRSDRIHATIAFIDSDGFGIELSGKQIF